LLALTDGKPIFLALLLSWSYHSLAAELNPFTSDGCSAFPEGTFVQNELWLECCTTHDYAYWQGGSFQQRRRADYQLKQCVEAVGEPEVANIMLAGVRVGGSPFWPTRFRWGYGWPYPRFYGELNEQELAQVRAYPSPVLKAMADSVQADISDDFVPAMSVLMLIDFLLIAYLITNRSSQ